MTALDSFVSFFCLFSHHGMLPKLIGKDCCTPELSRMLSFFFIPYHLLNNYLYFMLL